MHKVAREEAEVFGREEKDGARRGSPIAAKGSKDSVEPGFKWVGDRRGGVAVFFTRGGPMKGRGANVSRKPRWGKFIRGDGKSFEIRKGVSNHDDGDTRGKEGEGRGGGGGPCFQAE